MKRELYPFDGEPPNVKPGDRVKCRTAFGNWVPMVALSTPRYDRVNAIGNFVFLTVRVSRTGHEQGSQNWPAEDVRVDVADEVVRGG